MSQSSYYQTAEKKLGHIAVERFLDIAWALDGRDRQSELREIATASVKAWEARTLRLLQDLRDGIPTIVDSGGHLYEIEKTTEGLQEIRLRPAQTDWGNTTELPRDEGL